MFITQCPVLVSANIILYWNFASCGGSGSLLESHFASKVLLAVVISNMMIEFYPYLRLYAHLPSLHVYNALPDAYQKVHSV